VTLIAPSELTVTYRVAVVAALAGKERAAPVIKVNVVAKAAILRKRVLVMG
jgi:hypothetical protein